MSRDKISIDNLNISSDGFLLCPKCGGCLSKKIGRYGAFWGCNNYKELGCDFTLKYSGTLDDKIYDIIKNNDINKLKDRINSGSIYAIDKEGNSLLMLSIILKKNEMSKLLIKTGVYIDQSNLAGDTPLIQAVKSNNEEIAKILIESNVDTCETDANGNTALMLALQDYPDFNYKILLKKDYSSVYVMNNEKINPLIYAIQENMKGVVLNFINAGVRINGDILRWAIKIDYIEFIERYFENTGINVNCHDASGNTFLIYAIKDNSIECADFFLKRGANIYQLNKKGDCALSLARNDKNSKILELINKYKGAI